MRNVTPKMQQAYDLRMSGKLEPEIASLMGISLKGAFQFISRCRALGMNLPRRRSLPGERKEPQTLPPNMPSKKIPRCPDCQLMLSSEGTCIDCPADKRRMLVLLTNQQSMSGSLYEGKEEVLEMGLLKAFKDGVRRMETKFPNAAKIPMDNEERKQVNGV